MAKLLKISDFTPRGVLESDAFRARQEESRFLREQALSFEGTHEVYDVLAMNEGVHSDELMPNPDDVEWFDGDTSLYDHMASNVLRYGSLASGRVDVVTSLKMSWLPGVKGDAESEAAREEVEAAWDNIDENRIAIRAACTAIERGFQGLENVWGVHSRGAAKNLIAPIAIIDRPRAWFGFDYLNRPRFKKQRGAFDNPLIPELKMMFMRTGSLHTRYGRGYGPRAYPAVWTIDALMKGLLAMLERFGWMPMIITYPDTWRDTDPRRLALKAHAKAQWKNVFMVPGAVDTPEFHIETEGSFAAAGGIGSAKLQAIAKLEEWLSMYVQGSMYSSGNQQQGSFARDSVADGARLYKAPTDAASIEAMLNRGFVRPIMTINRPQLEESKWPRCAIDASFGSDLELLLRIFESGAKLKVPISAVTWSEAFKVQLAQPGEPVLEGATAPPQLAAAKEEPIIDAAEQDTKKFSEQAMINIMTKDGGSVSVWPWQPIYTENRGTIRASMLQSGDVAVLAPDMVRA